jgi:putative protein kinase ArgK-like GTPase of G3E family
MVRMHEPRSHPSVLLTRADVGEGVEEVVDSIEAFLRARRESGQLEERRLRHLERETLELIGIQARRRTMAALDPAAIAEFTEALRTRRLDPATVAARALARARVNHSD